MKCPLIMIGVKVWPVKPLPTEGECLKEQCAWWEQDINLCSIKELALELRYTQQRLGDLSDKILEEKGGKKWSQSKLK